MFVKKNLGSIVELEKKIKLNFFHVCKNYFYFF
jgi:hypothetical protein